jgi:8-oxo-dGTP pyrophosphatase MutT (NUDIX family)
VEEARACGSAGLELSTIIRAAGGVIARHEDGEPQVLMVHRPKYDDWSFPKGKAVAGESDEDCALREVREETGLTCQLGRPLPPVSYRSKGRTKRVRYWLMYAQEGEFTADTEVDEMAWVGLDDACTRLTYDHDRALLDVVARLL